METMDVRASPYGKLLDARSALLSRAHWWMEGARRRRSGGASAALSLPGVQPKPPQPSCSTHSATDPTTHRLASPSQNRSGCAYSPRKNQWFPFHRLSLHRSPPLSPSLYSTAQNGSYSCFLFYTGFHQTLPFARPSFRLRSGRRQ